MRLTSRAGLIAAGLCVFAAGAWWLLAQDGSSASSGGSALPVARNAASAPPRFGDAAVKGAPLSAPDTPNAASATPTDANASAAVLTGRITRAADDSSVAGVTVVVWVQQDGQPARPPFAGPGQPVTDADGRYRFDFAQVCTVARLQVGCGPDTTTGRRDVNVPLALGHTANLDLQVGAGAVLSGLVVDTEGRGIPGATVRGWSSSSNALSHEYREADRTAVSDAAGNFVIGGLGPEFLLAADATGYVPLRSLGGTVPEGARLGLPAGGAPIEPPLKLVLSPAREIHGRVLGPGGAPVARAFIGAEPVKGADVTDVTAVPDVFAQDAWQLERRSAPDGSFVLSPVASVPYEVGVDTRNLLPWHGTHKPGDPDLVVQLDAGIVLGGLVTSAVDGAPVPSAEVYLSEPTGDGHVSTSSDITNAQGRFELSALRVSVSAELTVTAEGHALLDMHPMAVAETNPDLNIALDPERVLAGRVVDADGAPVPGASVHIEGDRIVHFEEANIVPVPTWESRVSLDQVNTNADGRFRFGELYAGTFKVTATHPQQQELRASTSAPSGREDLLLVLDPHATDGVTLVGHATDASTGHPVTSFELAALTGAGGSLTGESHAFENADGAFRITGIPPGNLQLLANAQGYAAWSAPLHAPQPGEQRVEIRFAPVRQLQLRVLDARQQPVQATLSFRDAQGHELMVATSAAERSAQLRTDAHGEALVQGLPADRIVITARAIKPARSQDFPLDLRPEPRGPVVLQLDAPKTVRLHVVVLGAPIDAPPIAIGADAQLDGQAISGRFTQNGVWPVESDVALQVLGAHGEALAQARLDGSATATSLVLTRQLIAGATRPLIAELEVPRDSATLVVEAAGYATSSQPLPAVPDDADAIQMAVLLHRG